MLTRHAKRIAQELADAAIARQKEAYRGKLERLRGAFEPPLTNAELSEALGLKAPDGGASEVGRFVSDSPRLRRVRPDTATRAVIDALLHGTLWLAVRDGVPGARRQTVVGDAADMRPLGAAWRVVNFAGRPRPTMDDVRRGGAWDDDGAWDLFAPGGGPEGGAEAAEQDAVVDARQGSATRSSSAETPVDEPGPIDPIVLGIEEPRRLDDVALLPIGFGAMRLSTLDPSTQGRPSDDAAIALLHTTLDGPEFEADGDARRLLDTADSYCRDANEAGHNERLIRRALEARPDLRERAFVATKAGLVRPGGRWLPDGRPEHLRAACEASLRHLGVDTLELLQLHAVDPKVPLADSVGTLKELRDEGKVQRVGLCNVSLAQLEEARSIVDIASVQNRLSLFDAAAAKARGDDEVSLLERCHALGIAFIAHSPLAGHRKKDRATRDKALRAVATKGSRQADVSNHSVALAWLLHLGPGVVPIPGATRRASLEASLGAARVRLDANDLTTLSKGRRSWVPGARRRLWSLRRRAPTIVPSGGDEVVLIMGPPAAGKTSRVAPYLDAGYHRLNRDEIGGTLDGLVPHLRRALDSGRRRVVLDNTYPTRASRRAVLDAARAAGVQVVALVLDVALEDALQNACLRMLARHERILSPDEIRTAGRAEPNAIPPAAVYRWFSLYEEPTLDEGLARVEHVPFERRTDGYDRRALILDYDGTLRRTKGGERFPRRPEQVEILPRRREMLERRVAAGDLLLGISNQSGIARGQLSEDDARACFERTNELLGQTIDVRFCPHAAISAGVWCRKPMPGLGVQLIEEYRLDRGACIYVGDQESDRDFAAKCGFEFAWAWDYFDDPAPVPVDGS
ncbi:MAG: aldo/keto reductase [Acidobacteriota bacterium]